MAGKKPWYSETVMIKSLPVPVSAIHGKRELQKKKEHCYNIIYNSIPYGLLSESKKVKSLGASALRLSFTLENGKETEAILREFTDVYFYGKAAADREFTKGHFKRGAE